MQQFNRFNSSNARGSQSVSGDSKRDRFVQVRHFDFHARVHNSIQDLDELTQQLGTYLDYFGHYLDAP